MSNPFDVIPKTTVFDRNYQLALRISNKLANKLVDTGVITQRQGELVFDLLTDELAAQPSDTLKEFMLQLFEGDYCD